jgi:plastocyanin
MKKGVCVLALILAATVLAACGSDDSDEGSGQDVSTYCPVGDESDGGGGGGQIVTVSADASGAPKFKPTSLQAEAGELTIEFKNPSPRCHDLAVKSKEGEALGHTQRIKQGKDSLTLDLQAGDYVYYSTIPGEQDAGMLGELTVK